jgi:hypothetical protein
MKNTIIKPDLPLADKTIQNENIIIASIHSTWK